MAQAIHTMLGKRLEHKIEIKDQGVSHEQKKQEVSNSDNEAKGEEEKRSHDNNGELVITQVPLDNDKNSEGKPKQEKQVITNSDSVSTSEVGKCNQISDEVTEMQDSEDEDEESAETSDLVKSEAKISYSNEKSKNTELRTSGRVRKQPVTRGDDFLWTEGLRPLVHH